MVNLIQGHFLGLLKINNKISLISEKVEFTYFPIQTISIRPLKQFVSELNGLMRDVLIDVGNNAVLSNKLKSTLYSEEDLRNISKKLFERLNQDFQKKSFYF